MKISCVQMDVIPSRPDINFPRVAELIEEAAAQKPDVIVLPESWDISFLPRNATPELYSGSYQRALEVVGGLAKKHAVNIVAGSVTRAEGEKRYNTCCVFDRQGALIASYDKTHLFSHAGEDKRYEKGDHLCTFTLDGVRCGVIICYDLRFPELTRTMCLEGMDVLFAVAQWPGMRTGLMRSLVAGRAAENQIYAVCCDACGTAGPKVCGGDSLIVDPMGTVLSSADVTETIITADCDITILETIRNSIPVFRDRRPELYRL